MTIDILVKVYKKWGQDNNIKNLESADEMLLRCVSIHHSNLSEDQEQWLEKFIKVWDKLQNKERGI